eukprot:CAMPEP_0183448008 /NCGR_PEP_ID=MMETSP0370-20130417/104789_1 /TAXON_ID=268820 /ORGANISM="Peridinium aciculiferum, Strain PAER-2" /LENGTH=54 /DNA_ID=CAMNT_0025638917 /DNA_START=112 /DNA_END=276 /DNA_ORIENTATION=-
MYSISGSAREAPGKGRATASSTFVDTAPKLRANGARGMAGRATTAAWRAAMRAA